MSENIKHTANASESRNAKKTRITITGVSSDFIERRIRPNLDHLTAQILTLTQLLNELIQDNLMKINPTEASLSHLPLAEHPHTRVS